MVEVHHVGRKASATISTRHTPQLVEEFRRRSLPAHDAPDL
jgi:hypothetical protein